jgi:hypothetical protein
MIIYSGIIMECDRIPTFIRLRTQLIDESFNTNNDYITHNDYPYDNHSDTEATPTSNN